MAKKQPEELRGERNALNRVSIGTGMVIQLELMSLHDYEI